jgi:hypothetical protein
MILSTRMQGKMEIQGRLIKPFKMLWSHFGTATKIKIAFTNKGQIKFEGGRGVYCHSVQDLLSSFLLSRILNLSLSLSLHINKSMCLFLLYTFPHPCTYFDQIWYDGTALPWTGCRHFNTCVVP